jgi:hypothetical protein
MSANSTAHQDRQPPPAPEAVVLPPAGKPARPGSSRSLMKLLTFSKADEGPMGDFPSERKPGVPWLRVVVPLVCVAVVVVGAAVAAVIFIPKWQASAAVVPSGQLVVISEPAGAEVRVDGQPRGVTPLNLSLPAGPHSLQLNRASVTRTIAVAVKAGSEATHYVDLQTLPVAVSIKSDKGTVQRSVTVERGQTASLVVSLVAQSSFGWVSIASPVVMQVFEGDQKFGTTETDRIVMSAGRHTLKIVNTRLGVQLSRSVDVPAGGAAAIKVDVPDGLVNLNALPWAEAWIDGRRIGETPLANIKVALGDHEALFRHPQLGERRQTFTVTANEPTRVALDLRK